MNRAPDHPRVPPDVQARRDHLQAVLAAMAEKAPSREAPCLVTLRSMLHGDSAWEPEGLLALVAEAGVVEEAEEAVRQALRQGGDPTRARDLAGRLATLAQAVRRRRAARWQLDTRRTRVRCWFRKHEPALGFDDGELHAIFLHAFRLEGLQLALDLGKRPRPLLGPTLPLPAGVGGDSECVDVTFSRDPDATAPELLARLNQRLPAGLQWLRWEPLPSYSSDLLELAQRSHWSWEVPSDRAGQVQTGISSFAAAPTWPWSRKEGGHSPVLDLKDVVEALAYEGVHLHLTLKMGAHHALNPLKVLGALFALDPGTIHGVRRLAVELAPDPRLGQGDRFEPKLKNMYEDAVLLGSGSNIILVDEDDDEPIHLG